MKLNTIKKNRVIAFYIKVILLLGGVVLGSTSTVSAQDEPQNVEVKMKDGSTVIGILIEETTEKLVIKTQTMGEITILKSNMVEYKKLRSFKMVDGQYWHENPNPTRNLYGPTGYSLRKGEGYYQNYMIFLNHVSYGFTDKFTVGVGFEIVSLLAGANNWSDSSVPFFTLTPKYSFEIQEDKWNAGVGVLAAHLPGTDQLFSAGIVYGVSTWGSRDNNFTLGLGFGVADGEFTARPTVTLSGNYRVGRRFGLVSENWFIPIFEGYISLITFGGRYIGERITWDFALVGAGGEGEFFVSPIPLVGITLPFGEGWRN